MATLSSIWRGRGDRLWRLRVLRVPLVPGGNPDAVGDLYAEADLSEHPAIEYGEGSSRYGPSVTGSRLSVRLIDPDGTLAETLEDATVVDPGEAGIDGVLISFLVRDLSTPDATVVVQSGRASALYTDGFEADLDAGRGGFLWAGFLDGTPEGEGDERARGAVTIKAVCGLRAWADSLAGVEPGRVHLLDDLLAGLPRSGAPVRHAVALDLVPENAPAPVPGTSEGRRVGVLPPADATRSQVASNLLDSLSHVLWRPFAHAGLTATEAPGWRVAPRWWRPYTLAAGPPGVGDVQLSAGERPARLGVPAEISITSPTVEPTHVEHGSAITPGVLLGDSGIVPPVDGLLRNGDLRRWYDAGGGDFRPHAFDSGGAFAREIEDGRYVAEIAAGTADPAGWLWAEAWQVAPNIPPHNPSGASWEERAGRFLERRGLVRRRTAVDAGLGLARVGVRVRLSGTGTSILRLHLLTEAGDWYTAVHNGGWTARGSAPTPGDTSETFGRILVGGTDGLFTDEPPPAPGRLFAEIVARALAPRVEEMAVLISYPNADGVNAPTPTGGDYSAVDAIETAVTIGGAGPAVSLPALPPAYVSTYEADAALTEAGDPGAELGGLTSATTGERHIDLAAYALATAAALRGLTGDQGMFSPRILTRDVFGLVSPDHAVTIDGRRYVAQAGRLDLADEVTENAVLLQVPVWDDGAWSWAPQP